MKVNKKINFFCNKYIIHNNAPLKPIINNINSTKYSKLIKYKLYFIFLYLIIIFQFKKNKLLSKNISSKWIVITTINPPNSLIYTLLKNKNQWKIIVIGDNRTKDEEWNKLNSSSKLVYLSLKDQIHLNYNILKYIPINSYSRKNIGYLYAIEHGAREIFEIEDNIKIKKLDYIDYSINNSVYETIAFGKSSESKMINPYSFFGINDIWPRGFRLKDIGKEDNNIFYNLTSTQINLRPLIYQGLINGEADVDSLFIQTRIGKYDNLNINFDKNCPLLYLPNNYVPINSKNTKYLYDIFPALPLLTTINNHIMDIIRGYIIQKYAWKINGSVIFISSDSYINDNKCFNKSYFKKEKYLYFYLDNFLNLLNNKKNSEINNPTIFLINIIEVLVKNKIVSKRDLNLYKAFFKDLKILGYSFPSFIKLNYNKEKYVFENSFIIMNLLNKQKILLKNNKNIKLKSHIYSNNSYNKNY